MALIATQGLWLPAPPMTALPPALSASQIIDATGEKFAFIGRVWNKDRASKNITKVGFRFGTVVKAGGSALTVSLQDADAATGPPFQPDGTQDQTVAIANGDASFLTGTYYHTAALSAVRAVTFDELMAAVIEYDGAGRLGSDSVSITSLGIGAATQAAVNTGGSLFTASWAGVNQINNIILEFDDGTFGTLNGAWPMSAATGTLAFNSGSAADEAALEFTVPFPCKVDGAWMFVLNAASADFDIVLYENTTPIATASIDANITASAASARPAFVTFPENPTLTPGTVYYLALKPTTVNNVTIYYFDVAAAAHFQAHAGDATWRYSTRVDGGSWAAATTTRRPFAGLRFSALDDGVAGAARPWVVGG